MVIGWHFDFLMAHVGVLNLVGKNSPGALTSHFDKSLKVHENVTDDADDAPDEVLIPTDAIDEAFEVENGGWVLLQVSQS